MQARVAWRVGVAMVVLAAGAVGLYLHRTALPACTSDEVQGEVYATLRERFHLTSVFLNDIRTTSGNYLSDRYVCAAEITEIRGNIAASALPWRAVSYQVMRQATAPAWAVTVTVGNSVPLAPKAPTFWQRLLAHL